MEDDKNQLHYMQISVDHMDMMGYLTDEQRGITFRHVFAYFRGGKKKEEIIAEISPENKIILPIFDLITKSIDRGRNAYEERCRTNRENGKKGGAPKGNQNARKRKENDIDSDESEEDFEEDFEEDYSNTTLAHWYNCLSNELNEAKTSFSAFFNFEQLCIFFEMWSIIVVLFEPQPTQSGDMSFESYLRGGVKTFIQKYNELGAEGFLNNMKSEYKSDAVNHALAENAPFTKEELEKKFDNLTKVFPITRMILSSVAQEYH